ncbi:hypothetical protein AAL_04897 [Moelleriella libera RCEF 2490]|uniref:Acetate kinase n=1 Tax=Moelleriella libera RCEF 2490 TaxID=1081109 RepID=A0A168B4L1_9HYPO|nr:hypothetical protein AAL_04897 [Moelleriella libera RCEF 2490]
MAGASSSSGSSFTSSSLGRRPTYGRSYVSPVDSTWTPTSVASTLSAPSIGNSPAPRSILRPLDLGPPGYKATMILYPDTVDERTVYLGPCEIFGSEHRRVMWQCSYQNEVLEHFLPSHIPSDIHPHTLHARHRQYHDPSELERFVYFPEPHRIRYTTDEGRCVHDQWVQVAYEFTSPEESLRFQGNLRGKTLVGFYDVDVVWTDVHRRLDAFGKVKGIGAIQRMKMWQDQCTNAYTLSVMANKTDRQYREYAVNLFDSEPRNKEERHKSLKLSVLGRRRSAPDQDYRHFLASWSLAHNADQAFQGVPFPPNQLELPPPQVLPGQAVELASPDWQQNREPEAGPEYSGPWTTDDRA